MSVPILMYHSVCNDNSFLSVGVDKFYLQMKLLNKLGYKTTNFDNMDSFNLKKKFIITFDDGYVDLFTNVIPILKKFNFTATCFVIYNYIDGYNKWDEEKKIFIKKKLMSKSQILEWLNNGNNIGSHSFSHLNLVNVKKEQKINEIIESKKLLENFLSIKIDSFSYPYGSYDLESLNLVKTHYKYAVTTSRGKYSSNKFNHTEIPRVPVNKRDSIFKFFNCNCNTLRKFKF